MIEHSLIYTFIYLTNTYGAQAVGQAVWVVGEEDPRILSGWMTFEVTFRD